MTGEDTLERQGSHSSLFKFPIVERKVFKNNFLKDVIVELRFPTFLRLKESEPVGISEAIRSQFPIYDPSQQMQMTPLGTTDRQPVYRFLNRKQDKAVEITASHLVLSCKGIAYMSFDDFLETIEFLVKACTPHLETDFFTRVGLRYVNFVGGMQSNGTDLKAWINQELVAPVGGEIGSVHSAWTELAGPLMDGAGYTFRYGLSPPSESQNRQFVLDWDYNKQSVEVGDCAKLLSEFHGLHYPFFWWSLGEKAKEALENGTAKIH